MNKLFSALKKIQIKQILTAFVLGTLLFVTQACSSVDAKSPDSAYKGGMNGYSDVDPRSEGAEAAAKMKAKGLRDNSEVNLKRSGDVTDNLGRALDRKGENVKQSAGNAADKAKESASDFAEGTKRGISNIKENTSDALDSVTNNAGDVAEDAKLSTQRAAEDAKLSTQRAAEDTGNAVQRTLRDAVN